MPVQTEARTARIFRLGSYVRRVGIVGTARRLATEVGHVLWLRETHVWYVRDLTSAAEPTAWPNGVSLVAADDRHLQMLGELDTINVGEAQRRLAEGARWWLAIENARPLFSCWIFYGSAPVIAATKGRLVLPVGTVALEDSVTTAAARGRGIAPKAWTAIAALVHAEGPVRMVTKVAVDNTPSRRAVVKAGFAEFALVRYLRVGRWTHRQVRPLSPTSAWLFDSLGA